MVTAARSIVLANRSGGIIGWAERRSARTNAAARAAPMPNRLSTWALRQPAWGPRSSASVIAKTAPVASSRPAGSSVRAGPRLSASSLWPSVTSATPIGTLTQNTHGQAIPCTIAPPITGPKPTATPVIAPQAPTTAPRRWAGNASVINTRLSGVAIPPPAPCTARAAIKAATLGASAHAAEAAVNTAKPARNTRRRPNLSPSAVPVKISAAKARL